MDRRIALRHHVVRRAHVTAANATLDCAAFDLSVTGARLCLFEPTEFPQRVLLRLHDGVVRIARRRWQRGVQIGVEFDSQYEEWTRHS